MKKKVIVSLLTLFLFCGAIACFASTVSAKGDSGREKYIGKVYVEYGDTLWSIAKENMSPEYKNEAQLIDEIKKINHLYTDDIYAGDYILVPYFN